MTGKVLIQRRVICRGLLGALPVGLAGCASLLVSPTLRWREDELNQLLASRFPQERQVLGLWQLTLSAPQVQLLGDQQQLRTALRLSVAERQGDGRRWQGEMVLDSALRYQPSDQTVRLRRVTVQSVRLERDQGGVLMQAQRVGTLLVEKLLEDAPLLKLSEQQQARLARAGVEPGDIRVTPDALELTLVPRRAT